MKSSQEIAQCIKKEEIFNKIPSLFKHIQSYVDSSINMDISEINDFKTKWQINIPDITSKWIIVNGKIFFVISIERDWGSDSIYYLWLANEKQIFKCDLIETIEKYKIGWNK